MSNVPRIRVQPCNRLPVRPDADYVLYWMIAARRTRWNFALDRAVTWSRKLRKPLLIFEALRRGFPWEAERTRQFVLDGMEANQHALRGKSVMYYPYAERSPGERKGLLRALAASAAVVVTDEFPCFFLPRVVAAAATKLPVLLEQVDSNGLLPLRAATKEFSTAFAFRRFLQGELPKHLLDLPSSRPLMRLQLPVLESIPKEITSRWPPAALGGARRRTHSSEPSQTGQRGGSLQAGKKLERFLAQKLKTYHTRRNEPSEESSSGLSPYLHFGHASSHQIFWAIAKQQGWKPARLALRVNGSRTGWWGMRAGAEAFLDQLSTWRELGFNRCVFRQDQDRLTCLPEWARKTLKRHARDNRAWHYTLQEFAAARTHDPVWNAAQTQLLREGRIHNYLRMLWGKKILEWTRSPRQALEVMIELNNRYAIDGRDPNSYTGILWCLGKYDRPWGPERPIFGTVRYMSSASTMRKSNMKNYLRQYQSTPAEREGTNGDILLSS